MPACWIRTEFFLYLIYKTLNIAGVLKNCGFINRENYESEKIEYSAVTNNI